MLRRSPAPSVGIAIAISVLIAGCGGGDDSSASTSTTSTTVVITTTTTDPLADPDDPFCGTVALFSSVIDLPQNTLAQARARAVQLAAAGSALRSAAPDALADPVDRLAAAADQLELVATAATTLEEVQAAEADFQAQPDVAESTTAMLAWIEDNCGDG